MTEKLHIHQNSTKMLITTQRIRLNQCQLSNLFDYFSNISPFKYTYGMGTVLKQDFIERRCHTCRSIPSYWKLDPRGQFFELDLKMCQLKSLEYAFKWGSER